MSLHRRNPKRDTVEALIVETLRKRGFTVDRVSAPGFPDLVVSKCVEWDGERHRLVYFVEVKQPKGRLTSVQARWREQWQGPEVITLRSVEAALRFPEPYEEPVSAPAVRRRTKDGNRPRASRSGQFPKPEVVT